MVVLIILLALIFIFFGIILIRAAMFKPPVEKAEKPEKVSFDHDAAISALQELVRCRTVSYYDSSLENDAEFEKFIALLPKLYPEVARVCTLTRLPDRALLFKWEGIEHNAPSVMMAHYDVVPVNEEGWTRACSRVENHPFKMHITGPAAQMFDTLGRHSSFAYRLIFANLWCFGGVLDLLAKKSGGEMNALLRTTVAFTQASGSQAPNVIPPSASFVANLRLNPHDTIDSAVEYIKSVVADDNVQLTVGKTAMNPSPISETNCPAWDKVAEAVAQTWPGCIVSPYLMVQCSDSRHYGRISNHVYRFSAADLTADERSSIHGNDEHVRVVVVKRAVEFYIRLMGK